MTSKTLSTALQDKAATHNKLRKSQANTSGERDPLNRLGHVIAGSLGTYTAWHTFKLSWELPNQNQGVLLYFALNTAVSRCHTNKYENIAIVSPSCTRGHTITPSLSLERNFDERVQNYKRVLYCTKYSNFLHGWVENSGKPFNRY